LALALGRQGMKRAVQLALNVRLSDRAWLAPLLGWISVALFNIATLGIRGMWTGHDVAINLWPGVDNVIPERTAQWFLGQEFIPGVYPFDRGPLQPVILLALGGEWATQPTPALILGTVINSSWAVGLWVLLRALRIAGEGRIALVTAFVAMTGPVWMNTVFTWPKMLAATFGLAAAAAVFSRRPVVAGALCGLALLSHGTALFAVIGLVPFMIVIYGWGTFATLATAAALFSPWFVASLVIAAPGQPQMLQWHLGGTDIGTPDLRSPLWSVLDSYRAAGWDTIQNKVNNFRVLLGDPFIFRNQGGNGWFDIGWPGQQSAVGRVQWMTSSRLLLAPGVLLIGLFWARGLGRTPWMLALSWLATYGLLEWGGSASAAAFLHTAPFALLIFWVALCAVRAPRWMLPLQAAFFLGVWLFAPPVA